MVKVWIMNLINKLQWGLLKGVQYQGVTGKDR